MKNGITIAHPIDQYGHDRTDIDYYEKNGERVATVVKPLKLLHYKANSLKVESISKDYILKVLKSQNVL